MPPNDKLLNKSLMYDDGNDYRYLETELTKSLKNAINSNDLTLVKELLTHNNGLIDRGLSCDDYNILHVCAYRGMYDMLKMILNEFKPDVNEPNWYWRTPAGCAIEYCQFDCLSLLLEHGAEPNKDHQFADYLYRNSDKYIEYLSNKNPGLKNLLFKCIVNTSKIDIDIKYNDDIDIKYNDNIT